MVSVLASAAIQEFYRERGVQVLMTPIGNRGGTILFRMNCTQLYKIHDICQIPIEDPEPALATLLTSSISGLVSLARLTSLTTSVPNHICVNISNRPIDN
jgi:hypothetical protein